MQGQESRGAPRGRARWLTVMVAVGLVAALALSACGSSNNSSTSSGSKTTAAAKPTGTPITTYTFADVNTQGPQYKNIAETARIYADYINAHGGIAGHPLVAKFCDMQGTPTAATACARKAVADKAAAVVGSFSFTGDAILPVLEAGKIAYFGNCCAISPKEYTSLNSFPMGNQPLYAVGLVKRAVQDGCKKINGVIIQGAEAFKPLMNNAAKALGVKINKYISLAGDGQGLQPTGGRGDRRWDRLPCDDRRRRRRTSRGCRPSPSRAPRLGCTARRAT